MPLNTDLAVFNRNGQLTAIADVRNRRGTSPAWAASLRRNILAFRGFPKVEFLIVATPERLYLWKNAGAEPEVVEPDFEVDARPIFRPYFEGTRVDPQTVSTPAFELIVATWLGDLILAQEEGKTAASNDDWLTKSGFVDALKDGHLEYPTAA